MNYEVGEIYEWGDNIYVPPRLKHQQWECTQVASDQVRGRFLDPNFQKAYGGDDMLMLFTSAKYNKSMLHVSNAEQFVPEDWS